MSLSPVGSIVRNAVGVALPGAQIWYLAQPVTSLEVGSFAPLASPGPVSQCVLSAASTAVNGQTTYAGIFPNPEYFISVGSVTITEFVHSGNNGTFTVVSCDFNTLVVENANGVAETDPALAVVTLPNPVTANGLGQAYVYLNTGQYTIVFVYNGEIINVFTDAPVGSFNNVFPTEGANTVYAGPASGAATIPAFRGLVAADLTNAIFVASGPSHSAGAVPDPGSTAGTTRFLREDATWVSPSGNVTTTAGQVAFGTGTNIVGGSSQFTYNSTSGVLALTSPSGGETAVLIPSTGTGFQLSIAALSNGSYSFTPATTTVASLLANTTGLFISASNTAATCLTFEGASSGNATIGAANAAGSAARMNLPTITGTAGQVLMTDGNNPQQLSWTTVASGTIGGSITNQQVAVGNGTNSILGASNLTFDGTTLSLTGASNADIELVPSTGSSFATTILGNSDGSFQVIPVAAASLKLGTGGLIVGSPGAVTLTGASTGSAAIGVASAAGSPNRINLPTTTGTSGQVLTTDGNNPQQASWTTPFAGTIAANQIAVGNGTNTVSGSAAFTFTIEGGVEGVVSSNLEVLLIDVAGGAFEIVNTGNLGSQYRDTGGGGIEIATNDAGIVLSDESGFLQISNTGIGGTTITDTGGGGITLATGINKPSLVLPENGVVALSGINTGTLTFLENEGGYLNGTNQIRFNMFDTGTPPHGVWFNGTGQIFLETSSTNYNGGSIFMQNVVGQNNVLTQVTLQGSPPSETATYTGTFPNGGSDQLAGLIATFSGFVNAGNNVSATIVSSTGTTVVVAFTTQVPETHAGTMLVNISTPALVMIGSMWNGAAFVADTYTFQGVAPAAPNTNSILELTHSGPGGSGFGGLEVGLLISSGAITTNTAFESAAINGSTGLIIKGNTPATSGANVSSGQIELAGEYWTGGSPPASADDIWTIEDVLGTDPNPTSQLTITHSGSTGAQGVYLVNPNVATSPTNQFNAPSLAFQGSFWNDVGSPPVGSAIPDIFSFDLSNVGNIAPNEATSTLTLNHTAGPVAFFTLGENIFRFTSTGENVFGTVSATTISTSGETSDGAIFNLSAAGTEVGGLTTYTGVFATIFPTSGQYVTISGFMNAGNNGRFLVSGTATSTHLIVYNSNGISESHVALATIDSAAFTVNGTLSSSGFGQPNGFEIAGTPYQVTTTVQAEPAAVPFVVGMAGNNTDAGYLRIVNSPVTGNHGLEIGGITDSGTGSPPGSPATIQLGFFDGQEEIKFNSPLALTKQISQYNGVSTEGIGVVPVYYSAKQTGQSANFNGGSPVTLITPTANSVYRLSSTIMITTAASVSSSTPTVTLGWTDPGGIARTSTVFGTNSGNATTVFATNVTNIFTNGSTAVTATFSGYASSGSPSMQYAFSMQLEQLG